MILVVIKETFSTLESIGEPIILVLLILYRHMPLGILGVSGLQGSGNEVNELYEIESHITCLVIMPNGEIAGQFYGPNAYPTRDSLNSLLLTLGAEMGQLQCWDSSIKQ